jgi:chromosome segregation ATPase
MTREKIKNVFKIHEKGTFNFRNREGVIREINSILPVEEHPGYRKGLSVRKATKRYEGLVPVDGEKLNIFEGDANDVDEKLRNIERDNQIMMQSRSLSQQPEIRTIDVSKSNKLQANINYLKSQLEIKESRKEFVGQSRELLFKEISIQNKKEETEKLKEFIDTENEKLMEAKNSFKEDSDKFQKYVEELTLKAEQAKQETEALLEVKQTKIKMINSLRDKKADIEREISKVKNDLVAALDHKSFIMELAKELSTAMKTKGKKKKNPLVSESDSEFFITTAQEQAEENEDAKEEPVSDTPQEGQKETLPMTKETLLELIVTNPMFVINSAL